MSAIDDAVLFFVGLIGGIVVSVITYLVVDSTAEKRRRNRAYSDLYSEMEQNIQHQSVWFLMTLEDEAYLRFRSLGYMDSLDSEFRSALREAYSCIRNKNELAKFYLAKGELAGVRGADGQVVSAVDSIGHLRTRFDELLGNLATLFQDRRYVERRPDAEG